MPAHLTESAKTFSCCNAIDYRVLFFTVSAYRCHVRYMVAGKRAKQTENDVFMRLNQ